MSRIDKIFGRTAGTLVRKYGISMVFVRAGVAEYDKYTGRVETETTRLNLKGIVTPIQADEVSELTQLTDVKIIPDPDVIGSEPIQVDDTFEYDENGTTITAKVVESKQFRGDMAVAYIVMARPQ
jgi:hypothetical protein